MNDYSDSSDTIIKTSEEDSVLDVLEELGLKPNCTDVVISKITNDMAYKYASALKLVNLKHLEINKYEGEVNWIYKILQTCPKLQSLKINATPFLINEFKTLLSEINKRTNLVSINIQDTLDDYDANAFPIAWHSFISHNETLYEGKFQGHSFKRVLWKDSDGICHIPKSNQLQPYHFNWLQHEHPDAPFWQPHLNNKFLLIGIMSIADVLGVSRKFIPSDIFKLIISMLDSEFKISCLQEHSRAPEALSAPQKTADLVGTTILSVNQQDQLIQDFRDQETRTKASKCGKISAVIFFFTLLSGYFIYAFFSKEIFKNTDEISKTVAIAFPVLLPLGAAMVLLKTGVAQDIVSSLCPSKKTFEPHSIAKAL